MKNKVMQKFSILSGSFIVVSVAAIAANIPQIAKEFPQIPLSLVEMLTTIPALFIIPSVLLSDQIAQKFGYKNTVLLGLTIVLVSGLVPVFVHDFWAIFTSRITFGLGIGLFNSLLIHFISSKYQKDERATMIGLQSAFEGIGGMTLTFLVGQLLKIDWQLSFLVYSFALPVFFLFLFFVEDIPRQSLEVPKKSDIEKISSSSKKKIRDYGTYGYILLIFVMVIFYMTITVRVTSLMLSQGYGNATDGSNVLSFVGIGAMSAGFLFGKVFAKTKEYTLTIAFLLMSVSLFLIGLSSSVWLTVLAAALCGFSFRTFIPYVFNKVNTTNSIKSNFATALLLVGFNLGSAFSPYGISFLESLFFVTDPQAIFFIEAGLVLCFSAISFIYTTFIKLKYGHKNNYMETEN